MLYGSIPHVKKPISRLVFGTATPKMFAAFRSVYGDAPDFQDRLNAAFALLDDMPLKIWKTKLCNETNPNLTPGTCLGDGKRGLFVQCCNGLIEVLELQAAGGKRLDGKTFLRGKPLDGKVLQ